ncbi:MAG TPA: acyl-CoA dehydrogenase family protein [Acidimicrobiales bacterium]|nr:acyl-CoA dehydrogenase family protein [Acidimicrobiales bacterium]
MELEFSPEQEELRTSVRAMLEKECPTTVVREGAWEPLWKQMIALDWPAMTIDEAAGGLGMTFIDLAVVVEELGRVVAPGPFLPTVSQFVPALRAAGATDLMGQVARGELTGALVVDGFAMQPADRIGLIVDGQLHLAIDPELTPLNTLDKSRGLVRVAAGATEIVGPVDEGRILDEATVALALEMIGTCQAIFDMTLEYAKQREQFGVPIGSFQAVKHKLVDMYVALSRARACAYYAAATVAEDDERRPLAASMAKAAAGDAQRLICQEGIQIHGGIGYTWEHDLHLFVKRAKTSEALLGTAIDHRQRVAKLINL